MPRGRPPKPTKFKIVTGNPGKRPIDRAERKTPALCRPHCPDWLDDAAKERWHQLLPELFKLGLITAIDADALAAYCQAWAEFKLATDILRQEGRTFTTETGYIVAHPGVAMQRTALATLKALGNLFGLDPSSRSKLRGAAAAEAERDPFEDFLGGKKGA